jgi:hypothetical protein
MWSKIRQWLYPTRYFIVLNLKGFSVAGKEDAMGPVHMGIIRASSVRKAKRAFEKALENGTYPKGSILVLGGIKVE